MFSVFVALWSLIRWKQHKNASASAMVQICITLTNTETYGRKEELRRGRATGRGRHPLLSLIQVVPFQESTLGKEKMPMHSLSQFSGRSEVVLKALVTRLILLDFTHLDTTVPSLFLQTSKKPFFKTLLS